MKVSYEVRPSQSPWPQELRGCRSPRAVTFSNPVVRIDKLGSGTQVFSGSNLTSDGITYNGAPNPGPGIGPVEQSTIRYQVVLGGKIHGTAGLTVTSALAVAGAAVDAPNWRDAVQQAVWGTATTNDHPTYGPSVTFPFDDPNPNVAEPTDGGPK